MIDRFGSLGRCLGLPAEYERLDDNGDRVRMFMLLTDIDIVKVLKLDSINTRNVAVTIQRPQ